MRDVYRQVHVRLRNELTQSVHWGACGKLLTRHDVSLAPSVENTIMHLFFGLKLILECAL